MRSPPKATGRVKLLENPSLRYGINLPQSQELLHPVCPRVRERDTSIAQFSCATKGKRKVNMHKTAPKSWKLQNGMNFTQVETCLTYPSKRGNGADTPKI